MSRKGQIGQLIAIVPIMFLIFIIMAIFILLASAGSITRTKSVFTTEVFARGDLMERNIIISGKDVPVRGALGDVADNYIYTKDREKSSSGKDFAAWDANRIAYTSRYDTLRNGLKDFLAEEAQVSGSDKDICLIMFVNVSGQFGRAEFGGYNTIFTSDPGKGVLYFYFKRIGSGDLKGRLETFDIDVSGASVEGSEKNIYKDVMTPFIFLTDENKEVGGVYYYGECLKVKE